MRANRPSATARLVAVATIVASRERSLRHLVPNDAAARTESLLGATPTDCILRAAARAWATRKLLRLIERVVLPGIASHFQIRKQHIRRGWLTARGDSYSQLLVLGAGLDTLGMQAASADPAVRVVEVDHPATQRLKRAAPSVPSNIVFVPIRLDGTSHFAELRTTLDPRHATLIVAEGLLMYLPLHDVRELLREMATITEAPARIIGTFMQRWPDGTVGFRPQSRLVRWWLRRRHEPFLWGATPGEISELLREAGWTPDRFTEGEELRAAAGTVGCVGETIFEASRGGPTNDGRSHPIDIT